MSSATVRKKNAATPRARPTSVITTRVSHPRDPEKVRRRGSLGFI